MSHCLPPSPIVPTRVIEHVPKPIDEVENFSQFPPGFLRRTYLEHQPIFEQNLCVPIVPSLGKSLLTLLDMASTPFARNDALGMQYYHHPISGALFVPNFFHQFILPTIPERSVLPMQPLNWEFGARPDRPFDVIPRGHQRRPHNRRFSIPRMPAAPPQYPTAYYLEQLQFYQDGPLPEELEEEPSQDDDLRRWFVEFFYFLLVLVGALVQVLFAVAFAVLAMGKRVWTGFFKERTWEFVVSALVATQIVRILPRLGGVLNSIGGGRADPPPLYVLMIQNPNQWSK